MIRQGGGTVENVDIWGKRRLAFEIKKNPEGIYAVIDVTLRRLRWWPSWTVS